MARLVVGASGIGRFIALSGTLPCSISTPCQPWLTSKIMLEMAHYPTQKSTLASVQSRGGTLREEDAATHPSASGNEPAGATC
jgi:hypothetical protein